MRISDEQNADATSLLTLKVHYDGILNLSARGGYNGGGYQYAYFVITSFLSYDEVAATVHKMVPNVAQIFYRQRYSGSFQSSIRVLGCQSDIIDMLESVLSRTDNSNLVDLYVQHVDSYESDTASLEHVASDCDDELYGLRKSRLETREKKKKKKKKKSEAEHDTMQIPTDLGDDIAEEDINEDDISAEEEETPVGENEDHWDSLLQDGERDQAVSLDNEGAEWTGLQNIVAASENEYDSDGMHSDYPDSDEYDSPTLGSDDDELLRIAPSYATFDPSLDQFKFEPLLGMKFRDPEQLKDALRYYAVANKRAIHFDRSRRNYIIAKCRPTCTWRLYASWMSTESSFQIKSLMDKHKCTKSYNLKIANSRWISKVFHNKIVNNPRLKWRELKEEVKDRYHIEVSEIQCGKAKKFALGEVDDIMKLHYAKLWDYAAEVRESIPGSTVLIKVDKPREDHPGHFQRMYVCLGPLKKCWREGCRPVIGVDGCFLKTYCKGELLTAIGRDGNNWMFPIAWAVVESETKDAWLWFLQLLSEDLYLGDGVGYTLCSDQQKGLETAIQEVLPKIEHRMCARHVYANFRGLFSGGYLKNLLWAAAKCGTKAEFEVIMKEIGKVNPAAKDYLLKKKNPQQWCRAWFGRVSGCDSVENNMCETFNGVIVEARTLKIIDMLEAIRRYVTKRMISKSKEIEKWDGPICPRIVKKMEKTEEHCVHWKVDFCGGEGFEVKSGSKGYKLNLSAKTCSCGLWDVSGIPCVHALAVLIDNGEEDKTNYVAGWYTVEKIKKCYAQFLGPLNGENLWPKTEIEPFLPPIARRMPGRPKKQRRKSRHESPSKGKGPAGPAGNNGIVIPNRVQRGGKKNKCSICGALGHNKLTCKSDGAQSSGVEIPSESNDVLSSSITNVSNGVQSSTTPTVSQLNKNNVQSKSKPEAQTTNARNVQSKSKPEAQTTNARNVQNKSKPEAQTTNARNVQNKSKPEAQTTNARNVQSKSKPAGQTPNGKSYTTPILNTRNVQSKSKQPAAQTTNASSSTILTVSQLNTKNIPSKRKLAPQTTNVVWSSTTPNASQSNSKNDPSNIIGAAQRKGTTPQKPSTTTTTRSQNVGANIPFKPPATRSQVQYSRPPALATRSKLQIPNTKPFKPLIPRRAPNSDHVSNDDYYKGAKRGRWMSYLRPKNMASNDHIMAAPGETSSSQGLTSGIQGSTNKVKRTLNLGGLLL